jgi:hypothetical protein
MGRTGGRAKDAAMGGGADASISALFEVVEDEAVDEQAVARPHRPGREIGKVAGREEFRDELGGEQILAGDLR